MITRVCFLVGWLVGSLVRYGRCDFSESRLQVRHLARVHLACICTTCRYLRCQGQNLCTKSLQIIIDRPWFMISLSVRQLLGYVTLALNVTFDKIQDDVLAEVSPW